MRKPVLIVVAGPNGSGKTSTTHLVIKHEWAERCVYINPDEIAQSRFGDWNDANAVRQAVEYCETWREQLMQERKDFIFETVLSSNGKVDFLQRAKEAGYFIRMFFICTDDNYQCCSNSETSNGRWSRCSYSEDHIAISEGDNQCD